MKVVISPNFSKNNAAETTIKVCSVLHDMGFTLFMRNEQSGFFGANSYISFGDADEITSACDLIIAIGGDGTILEASSYAAQYNKLLLGINTGRLGFMASLETDELYQLSKLLSGDYKVEKRMMLDCEHVSANGSSTITALNDIVISGKYAKLTDFFVNANGAEVSELRADGIIFSTPTGSTAYALSAGGPILEPGLECIQMTPVCPHSLCSRTMLFATDKKLVVTNSSRDSENLYLAVDGRIIGNVGVDDKIIISRSEKLLQLIDISGNSFYNAVNRKLMNSLKG